LFTSTLEATSALEKALRQVKAITSSMMAAQ